MKNDQKIFDPDVISFLSNYLTEEEIKQKQKEVLKSHTIKKLENMILYIKEGKYNKALGMLCFSPAGDGHGIDNYFISFNCISEGADINEVIEFLQDNS